MVGKMSSTAERLRLLQRATAALSSASTPEEVAAVVARHSRILLGATSVSVYEVSGGELVVLGRDNPALPGDERWSSVPLDAPLPVSDAARGRSPVWIAGQAAWARAYPQLGDEAARARVASAAALPLMAGDVVVGAIAASFGHERSFTEADRDIALALAEASGQSLLRARLQRDGESQRRRAELLAEASYALDTSSNVRDRLAGLLALVVPDIADLATVRLVDEAGGPPALAALAHVDAAVEPLAWELFGRGGGSRDRSGPARVVRTGRPELIADVGRVGAADEALRDALAPFGVRSYAGVPLTARGNLIGALTLMTTADSGRRYDRDDLEFAAELARRAALAVDNARRYEGEQEARAAADRARRRTERLQRVTASLAAALTEQEVARVVVEEAMSALSAVAGVVVVREGDEVRVVVAAGYPPDLLASGMILPLESPAPLSRVLRAGEELWLETPEGWGRFGTPRPELGAAAIALPLRVGGEIIGGIGFRFGQDLRVFGAGDRNLALAMAGQLAQALERARLYESQRRAAEILQRSLLPASLPTPRLARVEVRYLPAAGGRSGGDFYDAIELPDGRLSLVVGDVVGHGTEAAAVMGQLRSAWRAFALGGAGPATVAASLSGFAALLDGAAVATVACALLSGDELRYACAGHPPPLLRRPDGVAEYLDDGRGPPLATATRRQAEGRVVVEPGALVLFYTDGVVERHRDIERGMAELAELVAGRPDDPGALLSRLAERIGLEPEDDCALLALQVLERPRPLRIEIAADPAALRGARAGIRAWLAESGVATAEAEDVVLAASEALANGVEHAYADPADEPGPVTLEMTWGPSDRLLVEIADRGRWRVSASAPAGRGRGLVLMRALMDSVDVDVGSDGTTVRLATTTGRASSRE